MEKIMHFINTFYSFLYILIQFSSQQSTPSNEHIHFVMLALSTIRSYRVEMEFESLRDHLMESEHVFLHMWLSPSLDPQLSVPHVSLHDNYLVCNGSSFYTCNINVAQNTISNACNCSIMSLSYVEDHSLRVFLMMIILW